MSAFDQANKRTAQRRYAIILTLAICLSPLIDLTVNIRPGFMGMSYPQAIRGVLLILLSSQIFRHYSLARLPMKVMTPLFFMAVYFFFIAYVNDLGLTNSMEAPFKILFIAVIYVNTAVNAATDRISEHWIERVAMFMLVTLVASQILGYFLGLSENPYKSEYSMTGIGSMAANNGRALAAVFVIFLINPRKTFNTVGLILSSIAIIAAFVRGPFLAFLISFAMTMSPWGKSGRESQYRNKFLNKFAVAFILLIFISYTPIGNDFLNRLEGLNVWEGGTASGRTIIWKFSLDHFLKSDLLSQIFGAGPREIPELMQNLLGNAVGSHSEWLDLLCSYGIIGALLYIFMYVMLIKTFMQLRSRRCPTSPPALGAISMLIILSLASGGTLSPTLGPVYCFLALLWGRGVLKQYRFGKLSIEHPGFAPPSIYETAEKNRISKQISPYEIRQIEV